MLSNLPTRTTSIVEPSITIEEPARTCHVETHTHDGRLSRSESNPFRRELRDVTIEADKCRGVPSDWWADLQLGVRRRHHPTECFRASSEIFEVYAVAIVPLGDTMFLSDRRIEVGIPPEGAADLCRRRLGVRQRRVIRSWHRLRNRSPSPLTLVSDRSSTSGCAVVSDAESQHRKLACSQGRAQRGW